MDLIDRQAYEKEIKTTIYRLLRMAHDCQIGEQQLRNDIVEMYDECTIEPKREEKRGVWSAEGLCPVCNSEAPYDEHGFWYESNFCPSCGADMRGDKDGRLD